MRYFLATLFAAAILAGCSERAPRMHPDGERGYNGMSGQGGESLMRERTLKQGSASRME